MSFSLGLVRNVRSVSCDFIEWDAPVGLYGCIEELTYQIRFYTGKTYGSTPAGEKVVMKSSTTSLLFSPDDVPTERPLYVSVSFKPSAVVC